MLLGVFAFSLSFMSVSSSINSVEEDAMFKPRLVTYVCPSGYSFQYYDNLPGWTDEDYEEMQGAVCNDPNNQPELTQAPD